MKQTKLAKSYKRLFTGVLDKLKNKGVLVSFCRRDIRMPVGGYKFCFTVLIDKSTNYYAEVIFITRPSVLAGELESRSSSRSCVIITASQVDPEKVLTVTQNCINGWKWGMGNEKLFEEEVLIPLSKKRPDLIEGFQKASPDADKSHGFDFLVLVKIDRMQYAVKINVKSSHNFLDKHKERYPDVGTFVFHEGYLRKRKLIEKKFIGFLVRSTRGEIVHT